MKYVSFLIFLGLINLCNNLFANIDSLLIDLDRTLSIKDTFFNEKAVRIQHIYNNLKRNSINQNSLELYKVYNNLFTEYESFIYDSAFKYAQLLNNTAIALNDKGKVADSKLKLGFVLMSSGLFKEAIDTLKSIDHESFNKSSKAEYYATLARAYYDLADYNRDDYYSKIYSREGIKYNEIACKLVVSNSLNYWSYESLRRMKNNDIEGAKDAFELQLGKFKLDDHQYAIATSSLGYIYTILGNDNKAIEMLIKAAIADIKASTKETVALRNLSNLLYRKGDVKTAYRYIKLALDDATFYNARHRKIEIASILPIIEGEKLNTVEKQKSQLTTYSIVISILVIVVLIFIIIIFRQLNKLKLAKQQIQDTNNTLLETNHKLLEANKIKDEYIGYFFNVNSDYINKIEKFQRDVNRKLTTHQVDDIKNILNNIDLKKEREELFHSFDKVFLKLFPDFVNEFNALFKEEDKIVLKEDELLNTDLRIFALIRMGISDNEKIAKILEYSVNTIYTYKTKTKNKSVVPNEEFEKRIMAIKSV